jgi:two-component system response regulator MprA
MIVDDDEDFATAAAKVLTDAGHEVTIVLDHRGAVGKMETRRPDLVVLDVMFPEDSEAGFELARAMRRHPSLSHVPVLMLTAVNAKLPLGFGATDVDDDWLPVAEFLEKPVDLDVLAERVVGLLARASQPSNRDRFWRLWSS